MKNFDFSFPFKCRDQTLEKDIEVLKNEVIELKKLHDKQFELKDFEPKVDLDLITVEKVKSVLLNTPPYNYGSKVKDLRVDLEMRDVHTFKSGAKYKGQWNPETDKPEGKGWLIDGNGEITFGWWKDGKLYKFALKVYKSGKYHEFSVEKEKPHGWEIEISGCQAGCWFGSITNGHAGEGVMAKVTRGCRKYAYFKAEGKGCWYTGLQAEVYTNGTAIKCRNKPFTWANEGYGEHLASNG